MIPFLQFHALAATRGEGLRPEFLDLFRRQAEQAFINPLESGDDAKHESESQSLISRGTRQESEGVGGWILDRPFSAR